MADKVRVLVVGLGNMGKSHASAYHRNPGFEIVGIMSRTIKSKPVPDELKGYPLFEDFDTALAATKPDAVSINSWPNTHAEYAIKAMNAGAHVFMEKPIATTVEDAEKAPLLRRVTFDLIGLPPSPDEIAAFAPNAFDLRKNPATGESSGKACFTLSYHAGFLESVAMISQDAALLPGGDDQWARGASVTHEFFPDC